MFCLELRVVRDGHHEDERPRSRSLFILVKVSDDNIDAVRRDGKEARGDETPAAVVDNVVLERDELWSLFQELKYTAANAPDGRSRLNLDSVVVQLGVWVGNGKVICTQFDWRASSAPVGTMRETALDAEIAEGADESILGRVSETRVERGLLARCKKDRFQGRSLRLRPAACTACGRGGVLWWVAVGGIGRATTGAFAAVGSATSPRTGTSAASGAGGRSGRREPSRALSSGVLFLTRRRLATTTGTSPSATAGTTAAG